MNRFLGQFLLGTLLLSHFLHGQEDPPPSEKPKEEVTWEVPKPEYVLKPWEGHSYTPSPGDWRDVPMYQIMTDRFKNGNPRNDFVRGWYGPGDWKRAQGGDWKGIEQHLDYLHDLGIRSLWISCVHRNVTFDQTYKPYHAYHPTDFFSVEPQFGTLEELRSLISKAHEKGMYVILDIVINHLADLAYLGEDKDIQWHYPEGGGELIWSHKLTHAPPFNRLSWFHNHGSAYYVTEDGNQYGDMVPGDMVNELRGEFLGGLDDLNYDIKEVSDTFVKALKLLIDGTDCDGFRVDAVKHVSHDYLAHIFGPVREHARQRGKENFLVFGEAFEARAEIMASFLNDLEMNSMMNFPVHFAYEEVFANKEGTKWFTETYEQAKNYPEKYRDQLVQFIDTHDTSRIMGLVEGNIDLVKNALLLLYTTPQVPCLYYGTEQGFDGLMAGDKQREVMWRGVGKVDAGAADGDNFNPEHALYLYIQKLLSLRAKNAVFRKGSFQERWQSFEGPGLYAYTLNLEGKEAVVVFNSSEVSHKADLGVEARAGEAFIPLLGEDSSYTVSPNNTLPVEIPPFERLLLMKK